MKIPAQLVLNEMWVKFIDKSGHCPCGISLAHVPVLVTQRALKPSCLTRLLIDFSEIGRIIRIGLFLIRIFQVIKVRGTDIKKLIGPYIFACRISNLEQVKIQVSFKSGV